jgi:hypothetical protein
MRVHAPQAANALGIASDGAALELAALALGQTAPDTETLIVL